MHQSWNNGAMDGFVTSRLPINANDAVLSMGYYTRADLPYYYAVADAFTLCDNYYCSVIGPTHPNRLYTMAASIDPDGKNGGPLIQTLVKHRSSFFGKLTYTTMPEQLRPAGFHGRSTLRPTEHPQRLLLRQRFVHFKNFQDTTTALYRNAFSPQFPTDFIADAASGNLPQVSSDDRSVVESDHPPSPSLFGELTLSAIINTLTTNPAHGPKPSLCNLR